MDETIGVKGGHNDQRRSMIISHEKKKMLEEYEEEREIKELEKKVRKQQIYTLVKTLPIVIGGNVVQTIHDTAVGKSFSDKEEENSKWRIKEYNGDVSPVSIQEERERKRKKIITTPTGEKVVVYVEASFLPKDTEEKKEDVAISPPLKETPVLEPVSKKPGVTPIHDILVGEKPSPTVHPVGEDGAKDVEEEILDIENFIDYELPDFDPSTLSPKAYETFDRLRSRKIVEEYERQLKDIRYDLRKVIYEYNVLVDQDEEVVLSKDAEIILDRLSEIIVKIEELKRKIRVEDLDKYDDNYIYYLIEGYLREFKDQKVLSEIKDSPLYVMIAEKLDELEKKRDKFEKEVDEKKERLEENEEEFDKLKDQYYSIAKLNQQLLEFQYEQDRVLKEIQEKVANATTETERVQEEFQGMTRQSRRLLRMLSFQMFLPGPRFARGFAASAAAYLYFMNNVIRPNTVTRRYRVITVKDYEGEINDSIRSLEDAISLLGKTSNQIDKMISDIQSRFKDYFGVVSECDELLQNLMKVKSEVEEKEYEMQRLKKQQELELEKNNAKVKTIGEYPVN